MPAKKKALLAETNDGKLYVQLYAVMHPMVAMCDGIDMTFFGKGKRMGPPYMLIEDAIAWTKKELIHTSNPKQLSKNLEALELIQEKRAAEAALKETV